MTARALIVPVTWVAAGTALAGVTSWATVIAWGVLMLIAAALPRPYDRGGSK